MIKKNIIIICNSFWPDINPRSFRATELVKELSSKSHSVTVLKPNLTKEQESFAKNHGFKFENLGNFKREPIFNGKSKLSILAGRIINRVAQLFFEYPDNKLFFLVKKAIVNARQKYDLCISIAVPYPIHWGTAAGIEKNKIAKLWVADCGDPYMGDESDSFKHPFYFKYIEKYFCKKVDFISVPTENSHKGYYAEFWPKIKVIPQGFNFEEVKISEKKHNYNCPAFGYAGGIIPGYREPFELLDYLTKIKLDFKFIVYTGSSKYFERYKSKLGDKLIIKNLDKRENVLYEFSKLDFVVNFANKGSKQTASKLIDYHIINKPILNIEFKQFNSDVFDEFVKYDFSKAFIIENPEEYRIENVAEKFLNLTQN